jgi:hypothetical protein
MIIYASKSHNAVFHFRQGMSCHTNQIWCAIIQGHRKIIIIRGVFSKPNWPLYKLIGGEGNKYNNKNIKNKVK